MNTEWNKFSGGEPTVDDYPIWAHGDRWTHWWRSPHDMKRCEPMWQSYTHWKRAFERPDPPKEPTQRIIDDGQASLWASRNDGWRDGTRGFLAGIAYERAEVMKLLKESGGGDGIFKFVEDLRARCTP